MVLRHWKNVPKKVVRSRLLHTCKRWSTQGCGLVVNTCPGWREAEDFSTMGVWPGCYFTAHLSSWGVWIQEEKLSTPPGVCHFASLSPTGRCWHQTCRPCPLCHHPPSPPHSSGMLLQDVVVRRGSSMALGHGTEQKAEKRIWDQQGYGDRELSLNGTAFPPSTAERSKMSVPRRAKREPRRTKRDDGGAMQKQKQPIGTNLQHSRAIVAIT